MMKKTLMVLLVGLVLPLTLVLASETKVAADGPIVIGVSNPLLQYPIFASMKDGAEGAAAALGVKVVVADGQWNPSKQVKDMENFVAAGVQGILIWAVPFGSLVPAIEAAVKAGIPVATVAQSANTDKVLVHVSYNEAQVVREAAKFLIDKLGNKGSVIELESPPGTAFKADCKAAFEEVLKKSNVKILISQPGRFTRAETKSVMESLIQKYPDFDAVYALNDEMILGAIDAMSEAGIDPASKVTVGSDALPDALRYMNEGKLTATIDPFFGKQAGLALTYLVGYIKNQTKPPQKVILIEPALVTKAP